MGFAAGARMRHIIEHFHCSDRQSGDTDGVMLQQPDELHLDQLHVCNLHVHGHERKRRHRDLLSGCI